MVGNRTLLLYAEIYISHFRQKLNMINNVSGEEVGKISLLQ